MHGKSESPRKRTAQHGKRDFEQIFGYIDGKPLKPLQVGTNAFSTVRFRDTPDERHQFYNNSGISGTVCPQFRYPRETVDQEKVKHNVGYEGDNGNQNALRRLTFQFHYQIVTLCNAGEQIRKAHRTEIGGSDFDQGSVRRINPH